MKRVKVNAARGDSLEELSLDLSSKISLIFNDALRPCIQQQQQSSDSRVSVATHLSSTDFLVQIGLSQDVSVPLNVVDSLVSQLKTFTMLRQSFTSRSESDRLSVNLLPRQHLGDALPTHPIGFCSPPICELKALIDVSNHDKFKTISSNLEAHVKSHGIFFVSQSSSEDQSVEQSRNDSDAPPTAAASEDDEDPMIERCSRSLAESIESILRHSVDDVWREEVKLLLEANSIDEAKTKLEAMIATFMRATTKEV